MSSACIERIGIYKSSIPLREPFIISLGQLDHAENIIVRIQDSDGLTGFGEGSPFRTIHGESIETCFSFGKELASLLIGKSSDAIEQCSMLMDRYLYGNSTVKSAFDIAMHDIAAQRKRLPLYAFLSGGVRRELVTDYTVSLSSADKMAADALSVVRSGFGIVKVKLGGKPEDDILRIQKIRESIGKDITLRIDANQGWTSTAALEILMELEKYNIQHCEEPLPRRDFMLLPGLRAKSPVPIMADESCMDEHDAQRLIRLNACDSFNIKLGKSGGIFKAMKILRLAEEHAMPVQIGGFLESRLGFTASAHLALCSRQEPFIDFDTPLMFSEDHVSGGIMYGKGGKIKVPDTPGLGATYSDKYLHSLEGMVIG